MTLPFHSRRFLRDFKATYSTEACNQSLRLLQSRDRLDLVVDARILSTTASKLPHRLKRLSYWNVIGIMRI
jgi:hypothetical protein